MLQQDSIKVLDTGNGFLLGEVDKSRHPQLSYLERGALFATFEGVDTALEYVAKNMPEPKRGKSSSKTDRDKFNAFNTYEEALTTFRSNPEKVVKFDPSELRIKDESEAGSTVDYDVTGSFIDMGRYMEGIPEVMGEMHNGNARNRRVNFTIDLNQWYGLSHEDITHRSERILRLVDALEAGGIRSQLVGIMSNECGHYEFTIKHHDEPLTISDLAVITHPEFLRRIIFRMHENSKTWDYGYGSARIFGEHLTPEFIDSDNVNEMNIVIGSNLQGKTSIDSRFDQLERLLVWEMSKPVPEVSAVKIDARGIYFNPNGARDEAEIRQEGLEAIHDEG